MQLRHTVLLAGCAAGLSCSVFTAAITATPVEAGMLIAQAKTEKASPFAAAKDETNAAEEVKDAASVSVEHGLNTLSGIKAAGTKTNSPFAAAKEQDGEAHPTLRADRTRLWWLLLPVGLSAISYGVLRRQEDNAGA